MNILLAILPDFFGRPFGGATVGQFIWCGIIILAALLLCAVPALADLPTDKPPPLEPNRRVLQTALPTDKPPPLERGPADIPGPICTADHRLMLDEALAEARLRIAEALRTELGAEHVLDAPPFMGSEDVGALADAIDVPLVYWFFGGFQGDPEQYPVNHHPAFGPVMEPTLEAGHRTALAGLLAYIGRR